MYCGIGKSGECRDPGLSYQLSGDGSVRVVSLLYHHISRVCSTAYRVSHREVTSVKTIRWPGVGVGLRQPSAARSATGIRPKLIFSFDIITTPCIVLVFSRLEKSIAAQLYKPFSFFAKTTLNYEYYCRNDGE